MKIAIIVCAVLIAAGATFWLTMNGPETTSAPQVVAEPQPKTPNEILKMARPKGGPEGAPAMAQPPEPAYDAATIAKARVAAQALFAAARGRQKWTTEDAEAYAKIMVTLPVGAQEPLAAERDRLVNELLDTTKH